MDKDKPFDWYEYFIFANDLAIDANCSSFKCILHARLRSSVSRAYYSAFHHAQLYAIINYSFKRPERMSKEEKESVHQKLIDAYKKAGREDISRPLRDLRDYRNDCDYKDKVDQLEIQYKAALIRAQTIIDLCPVKFN